MNTKFFLVVIALSNIAGCGNGVQKLNDSNRLLAAFDDEFLVSRNEPTTSQNVLLNDATSLKTIVGLKITSFTQPSLGTIDYNRDGTFTYHFNQQYSAGNDKFEYSVIDEQGDSKSATVHITVQKAWTQPQYVPTYKKRFSLSNGVTVFLWQQSVPSLLPYSPFFPNNIWSQTYTENVGWGTPTLILKEIQDNWQAIQVTGKNAILVVGEQHLSKQPSGGNIVARLFSVNEGWGNVKVINQNRVVYPTPITLVTTDQYAIAVWNPPITIDNPNYDTNNPNSPSTIQGTELYSSVFLYSSSDQHWTTSQKIDSTRVYSDPTSTLQSIATDKDSRAAVLWTTESVLWTSYLTVDKIIFSDPIPVSQTQSNLAPIQRVNSAMDPQNNISMTWTSNKTLWSNQLAWDSSNKLSPGIATPVASFSSLYGPILSEVDPMGNKVIAWKDFINGTNQLNAALLTADGRLTQFMSIDSSRNSDLFLLSLAPNGSDAIIAFWCKDYYNATAATPGSTNILAGKKLFAARFTAATTANPIPVEISDLPNVDNLTNLYNFKDYWQITATDDNKIVLLSPAYSNTNKRYNVGAQIFTDWKGESPPSVNSLSLSPSLTRPVLLPSISETNKSLSVFWTQEFNDDDAVFSHQYELNTKTWKTGGAERLLSEKLLGTPGPRKGFRMINSPEGQIVLVVIDQIDPYSVIIRMQQKLQGNWQAEFDQKISFGTPLFPNYLKIEDLFLNDKGLPFVGLSSFFGHEDPNTGNGIPSYFLSIFH